MEKTVKYHQLEDHLRTGPFMATSDTSSSLSQSPSSSDHSTPFTENGKPAPGPGRNHKKKLERKGSSFAYRIREHVKMGPKFWETVKGKLSVGGKIIKKGGRENLMRDIFGVGDGEKLLKASQCYLSTTAGGGLIKIPYKLSIPVKKIKEANESENVNNPSQKYIEIVTQDNFEFWFMGLVRYEKAMMNLRKAISM